ncbi:MAG: FG-GAP repeat protein [Planctomycetes bacterium]|nr:FG-GAP repeat protein [Planctomycetota bacterium]
MKPKVILRTVVTCLVVLVASRGVHAQPVLLEFDDTTPNVLYGDGVAPIADVDLDGFIDVLVAATPTVGSVKGFVDVRSGKDGSSIRKLVPPYTGSDFGHAVLDIGDVNGDGVPDACVGAPGTDAATGTAGRLTVFSGATGVVLYNLAGTDVGERLGFALAPMDDVDHDGFPDFCVSSPNKAALVPNGGRLTVVSGATGLELFHYDSPVPLAQLGWSLSDLGDLDGDGLRELVAGAPGANANTGLVAIFSGRDLKVLALLEGTAQGGRFGAGSAGLGDVDGDEVPDVAVGAPEYGMHHVERGRVSVFSGADGGELFHVDGETDGGLYGSVVGVPGDVDRDGRADVLVSGAKGTWVLAGDGGRTIFFVEDVARSAVGLGDIDRDGHADICVSRPVWIISGRVPSPLYQLAQGGTSADGPGDFDGDGLSDFVVGDRFMNRAWLVRGYDGEILHTLDGPSSSYFGFSCAVVGDVDGDGRDDALVGARLYDGERGLARLVSGRSGQTIYEWVGLPGSGMGAKVSAAGDVNADGILDVLVGAPREDAPSSQEGRAHVYSGRNGESLYAPAGDAVNDQLGGSVAGIGDIDLDGWDDFAAGAPNPGDDATGYVRVFLGRTGDTAYTLHGVSHGDRFGRSLTALGDIDGDGIGDFIAGAPLADPQGSSAGVARVFSGKSGDAIYTLFGLGAKDRLGAHTGALGDVDGDGVPDFAAGATDSSGKGVDTGFVRLFSGKDAAVLATIEADSDHDEFGRGVSGIGDVDGDGRLELVFTAEGDTGKEVHVHTFDLKRFPWQNMGAGLAGQRGIPKLVGEGDLEPGRPIRLDLAKGPFLAPLMLLMGHGAGHTPYFGGYLVPTPNVVLDGLFTDSVGAHVFDLTWPGVPQGATLYFQAWMQDSKAVGGWAASNALSATSGDLR